VVLGRLTCGELLGMLGRVIVGELLVALGRVGDVRTVEELLGAAGRLCTAAGRDPGFIREGGRLERFAWALGLPPLAPDGLALRALAGLDRTAVELWIRSELPRDIGDFGWDTRLALGSARDCPERVATPVSTLRADP